MKITRVYATPDGASHFEDVEIALRDAGAIGMLSDGVPVREVIFRENAPDYDYDWHHAPRRQYIALLDGEIEIEVSDGEKRRFRGGDPHECSRRGAWIYRRLSKSIQSRKRIFVLELVYPREPNARARRAVHHCRDHQ